MPWLSQTPSSPVFYRGIPFQTAQGQQKPMVDWLYRLLLIYDLRNDRTCRLLLPTVDYNQVAIRGDKIVVWSTLSEDFTPLFVWDSTSKTLKHLRSQKPYEDFTVVRYADEPFLLSGISTIMASESVAAKYYDSKWTLESSHSIFCPEHPLLHTWESPNEFSGVLFSSRIDDSTTPPHYRFSVPKQKFTNVNLSTTLRHGC
jgi:hypothetical protein